MTSIGTSSAVRNNVIPIVAAVAVMIVILFRLKELMKKELKMFREAKAVVLPSKFM